MKKITRLILIILILFLFSFSLAQEGHEIYVAFVWNQHQPLYKNNVTGEYHLPWVRLHSAKDYYQMAALVEKYPKIHQTFNLTPSLVIQIQDYINGARDYYEILASKKASDLTKDEKKFIKEHFFESTIPWRDNLKVQFLKYKELLKKSKQEELNSQDYLDIGVFHNLAWIDPEIIENNPQLLEIYQKGGNFTEKERNFVLNAQRKIINKIFSIHKKLADSGQIEIITTPFYHPILPLLINTNFAKRSNPEIILPKNFFAHPEDAKIQIKSSTDLTKKYFGKYPLGIWPSEQAVCPEMVPMLKDCGINWMISDDNILAKSLRINLRDENLNLIHPEILYTPYIVNYQGKKIYIIFRDSQMSDRMGFYYGQMTGIEAAYDFLRRLKNIQKELSSFPGPFLVTIALDGENAWENYPDDKKVFLNTFYGLLSKESKIKLVTVSEYLNKFPKSKNLTYLATGSWNNGSLERWIGSPKKNKAWEMLELVRRDLVKIKSNSLKLKQAWESLYMAEGSDYCWWFDSMPYHQAKNFDDLFRLHLKNVYRFLSVKEKEFLNKPILEEVIKGPEIKVKGKIIFSQDDPEDELLGGKYQYPTDTSFYPYQGLFELLKYEVIEGEDKIYLRLTFKEFNNIWNAPLGFSHPLINIYIGDNLKGSYKTYKNGANIIFSSAHPWNYFIRVTGWRENNILVKDGKVLLDSLTSAGDIKNKTILIAISKKIFKKLDSQRHYVLIGSYESTAGKDFFRVINPKASGWFFSKGEKNSPLILDYLCPKDKDKIKILDDFERKEGGRKSVIYPVLVRFKN